MRYVRNEDSGEVHDRERGDERCNVDAVKHKGNSDDLMELLQAIPKANTILIPSLCKWCFGPTEKGR